ncbi:MAG: hypothetical protein M1337_03260 [Actinobacteria bacterium]|nr:hypothetical protein [Actinomycetota bacterium]
MSERKKQDATGDQQLAASHKLSAISLQLSVAALPRVSLLGVAGPGDIVLGDPLVNSSLRVADDSGEMSCPAGCFLIADG